VQSLEVEGAVEAEPRSLHQIAHALAERGGVDARVLTEQAAGGKAIREGCLCSACGRGWGARSHFDD
jgi:predicted TIM-barrel enzyme